jgi:phosphoribosyl 1,2-cyclic phosphodiesterase
MPRGATPSVQFAVLASGSRGNATLVRGDVPGVLIDAGIGPRALGERLESVGATGSDVGAVVLTHTHRDHIDSATFSEAARRRWLLYCHEGHRAALADDPGFGRLEEAGLVVHYEEDRPFLTTTGLRLEPIALRHDGGPTFGFRIEVSAERRGRPVSIGYLADTGSWSERMADVLTDVDVLGVEFNHDVTMQKRSGRPWILIQRNLGDRGHLSNQQGAELVAAVLERSRSGSVQHLVLLHLSQQCNRPNLAIEAARSAVNAAGRRAVVHAAQQCPAHPNLWVRARRRAGRLVAPRAGSPASTVAPARPPAPPVLAGLFDVDADAGRDPAGAP